MKKEVDILSLGMGRQSIYLLLKLLEEGKAPDAAIFCDLKSEPKAVYEYAKWFQDYVYLKYGFKIHVVSTGSLYENLLSYIKGDVSRVSMIPLFTKHGIVPRQCTMDYKISVVRRETKRLFPNVKKCNLHLGISFDERERIKNSPLQWINHVYRLVEERLRISDIVQWFKDNNLPIPPKSSCLFCPFHSDAYWYDLKINSPEDFELACVLDEAIRNFPKMREKCYLHKSCKPLREIDFELLVKSQYKIWPEQIEECHGYCGS